MELKEIISRRRSTRKFLPTPVERERLERVVEMALQAPSSRNSRSTRFMIVQNPDLLEKMSRMRDYGSAFMKDAAAAILVMGDKRATDLWIDNCAISATTLQLAVVDEGLASCWDTSMTAPACRPSPMAARLTTTCASCSTCPSITVFSAPWRSVIPTSSPSPCLHTRARSESFGSKIA